MRLTDAATGTVRPVTRGRSGELRLYACGPDSEVPPGLGYLRGLLLADLVRRTAELHRLRVASCQPDLDPGDSAGPGGPTAAGPGAATGATEGVVSADAGGTGAGAGDGSGAGEEGHAVPDAVRAVAAELNLRPAQIAPRLAESADHVIGFITAMIGAGHAAPGRNGAVWLRLDGSDGPDAGPGGRGDGCRGHLTPSEGHGRGCASHGGDAGWLLWRPAGERPVPWLPGDGGWGSPWGPGQPGPHVACAALAWAHLGPVIDVHTGGDGLAAHHAAVRELLDAAAGRPVTRHWLRAGPVSFAGDDPPLAAELPGELTRRGLDPLALRLALLGRPYAGEITLSWNGLAAAGAELARWRGQVAAWAQEPSRPIPDGYRRRFLDAFDDDLDTPAALAALRGLEAEPGIPPGARFETFADVDRLFGLDLARDIGRAY